MFGIAGSLASGRADERRDTLERMTHVLRHRGPDDAGFHIDPSIALGVRRLRVIDPLGGRQPIGNEDGTVWAVNNGEIYNFVALRTELEAHGHRFLTRCDTEVLVHAYEQYGEDCVARFEGMFALAIWDARERTFLLARDRMGEKPLHYYASDDTFVFGSELRALLEHPCVSHKLNLASVSRYLGFEYVPAPHSIITGVAKLPPAHVLTVTPGSKPRLARYWEMSFAPDRSLDEREWSEALTRQIESSVRRQLVADVPVGMFLSGGLDSSVIAAAAARVRIGGPLKTFALGFAEPSYDERRFAAAVARHVGTDHADLMFTADDLVRSLDDVGSLLHEPLVDSSFLPIYALSRLARESVVVVLSGDGGDELFCGYPTFLAHRGAAWVRRLPKWTRRAATMAINGLPVSPAYGSAESLLKQFVRTMDEPAEIRTQLLLGGLPGSEQRGLLSEDARAACAQLDPYDELFTTSKVGQHETAVDRLIAQHCRFYLAEQNLVTVDRASMACGLEVRAPFLDYPLVELVSRIPSSLKLRGWTTKYILRRAYRGLLPPTILNRRKQGFGVPIGPWLRGPLRHALEERLSPSRIKTRGVFDPSTVRRLIDEHVGGQKNHRKILWALLIFDAWCGRYLAKGRWSSPS